VRVSFFTRGCTQNPKKPETRKKPEKTKRNSKPERNLNPFKRNPFTKPDGHLNSNRNLTGSGSRAKFHPRVWVPNSSRLHFFAGRIFGRPDPLPSLHIEELLEMNAIRESRSLHRTATFIVRNHSKIVRGKSRMVINCKRLNDNTVDDAYNIPNKKEWINRIQGSKYFFKI
jgi:hypothetical protein